MWYNLTRVESKMSGCTRCTLVPAEPGPHVRYLDPSPESEPDFDLGHASTRPGPRKPDGHLRRHALLSWLPSRQYLWLWGTWAVRDKLAS